MNKSPIRSLAEPRARGAKGVPDREKGASAQVVKADPFRRESFPVVSCDGASVTATVIDRVRPANDVNTEPDSSPMVLVLPAMGTRAGFYQPFAEALAAAGCTVVTADLRGQGESDRRAARGDRFGYREIVERDLPALEAALRERYPARPLIVCAHSLGGQLATLSVGRGLMSPDALVLIAAGTAHWRHWPPGQRAKAFLTTRSIGLAARVLAWYPGRRLGFGGDQPRSLMADWRCNAATGGYRSMAGGHSLEPTGKASSVPVLSLEILGDLIAPSGAAAALCSRFAAGTVSGRELAPTARTDRWRRHFAWVREPAAITETVLGWWRSDVRSPRHQDLRRSPDAGARARRSGTRSRVAKAMLLGVTLGILVAAPTAALSAISVHGVVESKSGGFRFPDGSVQTTAAGAADPCPTLDPTDEMILVGGVCIDKYEASIWDAPVGGNQIIGSRASDYCNPNGQDCVGVIYARSVANVEPAANITWFQAQQALANSGKRLPTNAEWQMAVAGTPDDTNCNVSTGSVSNAGVFGTCVSDWGAFDMVGNLWEWVADWVQPSSEGCGDWFVSDDFQCYAGTLLGGEPTEPGALIRGGTYLNGMFAGAFAVLGGDEPSTSSSLNGFRGAR